MKIISFGVYEARIEDSKRVLSIRSIGSERGGVENIKLGKVSVLANSSRELIFRQGWFTHYFSFSEFTPGVEKVKYLSKLFHRVPFFRFKGEIGVKYKGELRDVIEKYSQ